MPDYPKPPYPSQRQPMPRSTAKMDPRPDHGEASYRGSGKLAGKRAVITGGDSGIGRAVAIAFAREVASRPDNEAEARRATSLLYHVASAVALAWEGGRIHEMRGDARRVLLSRLVVDHRMSMGDPFRVTENATQHAIATHLLGERAVGIVEVGELVCAA